MLGTKNIQYATEYQLDSISLITSLQNGVINMLPFMVELNLFEDIYSSTISGELVVSDALGLISNFRLNGTEFLQVTLRKSTGDNHPIQKNYRIYKISTRTTNESNAYEIYTINFCSEEFLLAEQYRVSKSFKGTEISNIIKTILTQYVKVGIGSGTKLINVEDTLGTYDFILPNKKLFETINWLATYALPKNGLGADMLFFENRDGYYFRSLQTLYSQNPYQTYKFDPKNISNELNQQVSNVFNFEVLDFFDTLGGIVNGTFANRAITINPLTRTYKVDNDFNYASYFNQAKTLNDHPAVNNYQNRYKKTLYDKPPAELEVGTLRMVTENTAMKKDPYISKNPDAVANDINIRKYLPNRVAQIALANYTRIKITVAGDASLTVGKTINFTTYEMNGTLERKLDPTYSGKYLITAVRHIVKNNSYITVLEMAKDSVSVSYVSHNTQILQKLVDGKS
jgi:hypothetical protein